MRKIVTLFLLTVVAVSTTWADTLKSESELRPFADSIMSSLVKGGIHPAFTIMKPYIIIPETELQSMELQSQAQRDQFGARYGKTIGYELINQRKLGESLVRVTYIEKTEKHAIPWMFYFYKSPSGWVLNSLSWNDQWPGLFSMGL